MQQHTVQLDTLWVDIGHRAPTICDALLGLANYNVNYSQCKCEWVSQEYKVIIAANRHAKKMIEQSVESQKGVQALNVQMYK